MGDTYRILMLEDEITDAELIIKELRQSPVKLIHKWVDNRKDFVEALLDYKPDLILADSRLPTFDGLSALQIAREHNQGIPFIFVSGSMGEETAVDTMKKGATDYVLKDKLYKLMPAIMRAIEELESSKKRLSIEAELGLTKERMEFILANSPVVIYNCDVQLNYQVKFISLNVNQLTGYEYREYIKNPKLWRECLHAADADRIKKEIGTLEQRKLLVMEYRLRHKDGHYLWIHDEAKMIFSESGEPLEIVGFWVDISIRKQNEEKILRQFKQINVLRNIEKAITSSLDLNIALHIILEQLIDVVGVDAVTILLPKNQPNILELAASMGFKTRLVSKISIPFGVSYSGKCALERKTIYIPEVQREINDPILEEMLNKESILSLCAIPLIARGQLNGVLELFYREKTDLDREDMDFLEALGSQAAVAIENATLFQESIRSNMELNNAFDATLEGWARALELREYESEGHTQRVCEYTLAMAKALNIDGSPVINIRRGALLHDIGMMGVHDQILLKSEPLTDEEWVLIKKHPVYAFELLASISYLRDVLDIPYCHHEKWDGTGYPRGLKGEQIPLSARLFALIDVWDALSSDRPYRKAWDEEKIKSYIIQQSGLHFDPSMVEKFLMVINKKKK